MGLNQRGTKMTFPLSGAYRLRNRRHKVKGSVISTLNEKIYPIPEGSESKIPGW